MFFEQIIENTGMYLTSFIPITIYLIILKSLDSFKLVKWKNIGMCILSGILCCVMAYGISCIAEIVGLAYYSPLIEEILKAMAAVILVRAMGIVFFAEALCYGAAIGGGFAILENIIYITCNPDILITTALFRGLGTAMLHIGCTSLFITLSLQMNNHHTQASEKLGSIFVFVLAILPSIAIHILYNLKLFSPLILLFMTVALFLLIFLVISSYGEKRISKWLDNSMMHDVQLLTEIRNGTLPETNTGKYLLSIKKQFNVEVFFDMICYIQLYLELKISAKSHIMLHEAGLDEADDASEEMKRKSMIKEFHVLRGNIGIMGEMILHPIVRLSHEELKIIEHN